MFWSKPVFLSDDVEVISEQCAYKGFYQMIKYRLRHRKFVGGWSPIIERELFERGSSAAVLAFDPWRQQVALVEQFRIGALRADSSPWLLEVIAGMVGKTESPEQVAARELSEEAGIESANLEPICSYLASPGGSSEKLYLFLARVDLSDAQSGVHGLDEENEDIYLHILSVEDAFEALRIGRCRDAATTICLQWLQLNLHRLIDT